MIRLATVHDIYAVEITICTCGFVDVCLIPYIANRSRWKSFVVFMDGSVLQNFSSETACTIGFGHARLPSNCESVPVNYSLVLQP